MSEHDKYVTGHNGHDFETRDPDNLGVCDFCTCEAEILLEKEAYCNECFFLQHRKLLIDELRRVASELSADDADALFDSVIVYCDSNDEAERVCFENGTTFEKEDLDRILKPVWIGEVIVPVWVAEGTPNASYVWYDLNTGRPSDPLKSQLLEEDALKQTNKDRHEKRFFLTHGECVAVFDTHSEAVAWLSHNQPCRVRSIIKGGLK